MPTYIYEASDERNEIVRGKLEAEDSARVAEYLQRKRYVPLKINEEAVRSGGSFLSWSVFDSVKPLERIVFVRNLAAAVHAGLDIIEALDTLLADTKKKTMRKILLDAKANLENGQPLSYTLSSFPQFFPPVCVGMVRAGEASGRLDETLHELNEHLTKQYDLTRRVRLALAYPTFLLIASVGVIVLLLIVVLPRLKRMFEQTRVELPGATKFLMRLSDIVAYNVFLDIGIVIAAIVLFIILRRTAFGRRAIGEAVFHTPFLNSLVKKVALVRITKTLGNSLASGIGIMEAIDLAADSAGNERYKTALQDAKAKMQGGMQLSKALAARRALFPSFLTGLLLVGEKTGTIENILKTFSDFYTDEVDETLKNLSGLLEPVLLLCMGLIIGWIALSLLLPVYQLMSSFR